MVSMPFSIGFGNPCNFVHSNAPSQPSTRPATIRNAFLEGCRFAPIVRFDKRERFRGGANIDPVRD
jgi:hypothetical protein